MHVMKFGGTSMGDADRIALVANLILTQAQHGRVGAVVSAVGGVTNKLLSILHGALRGDDYQADVRALIQQHDDIISRLGADIQHAALTLLRQQMATINEQLNAISRVYSCWASVPIRRRRVFYLVVSVGPATSYLRDCDRCEPMCTIWRRAM